MTTVPPVVFTVLTDHSTAAPPVTLVDVPAVGVVVLAGVVVEVTELLDVEVEGGVLVVVLFDDGTGSPIELPSATTASWRSPTCPSAALTICQVRPVVTARAVTHNAAILNLARVSSPIVSIVPSRPTRDIKRASRSSQACTPDSKWRLTSALVARIVLIEDDVSIRRLVAEALANAGHDVESADRALDGLELAVKGAPDLVILDLGLPDIDGTELLRMIRAVSEVPVIVITARGSDDTVVATLDAGADDYLIKPFSVSQLEARLRAVLRRGPTGRSSQPLRVGTLALDVGGRLATLDGVDLELSPKEFDLLRVLMERSGEVVSKRELLAEVWREPYGGSDRTVDVHLSWLRGKLGESAQSPRFIQTVHGVGVKLVDPAE